MAAMVAVLWRWLPERERDRLAAEMVSGPHFPDLERHVTSDAPAEADIGDQLDWDHVWERLSTATAMAGKAQNILIEPRMYFDFKDLAKDAERLYDRLVTAYELMCEAARHEGLDLDRGDNLDAIRLMVDIRRGELVDAELERVHHQPVPEAPTWTMDYRTHGGFIATAPVTAGEIPCLCYGFASTPGAAVHALASYFLDAPPTIVLDLPHDSGATRWVRFDVENSDLSRYGERVGDLLDARGSIYDEHIAACDAARSSLADADLNGLLTERADELNRTNPQLPNTHVLGEVGGARSGDYTAWLQATHWMPTRLVVATGCPVWGEFGDHRPEVPLEIAKALATTDDLHAFTRVLFEDEINLHRVAAWAGPIYEIGYNGNHRVHIARMLGLPWLAATVYFHSEPPSWDLWRIIARDPGPHHGSLDQRILERQVLIEGLLRRNIIDGELTIESRNESPVLRCIKLPAPWLLRSAEYATAVNRVYESRYPGALSQLGIPSAVGTDPIAWTTWLTS